MAKCKVKIKITQHKRIMIGFCTNACLGNISNYMNEESAYYYCMGFVFVGGVGDLNFYATSGAGDIV
jgi:hypothetical protein